MSCNYCWNQPKIYERYDLYLDGKIKADDFVFRTKDESGEIIPIKISKKFEELENRLETHFTFDNTYQTFDELEEAFAHRMLKESVIYIVKNKDTSDDPDIRDKYDEYMIMGGKLELIGSGSYAKQQADLDKEIADRIADVTAEEERAIEEEKRIEEKLDQEIADRIADVTAEEERAIEEEKRIEEKLNQEIEDRETDVDAEEKRAIEVENALSARIKTIEDYKIDDRVKQLENNLPAEEKRAKDEEKRIEENLIQEIKDRTAQIDGINKEAKENRNRIEQLENKIKELGETIRMLSETIDKLNSYHDDEQTDPEQGEGGNEPETPTE